MTSFYKADTGYVYHNSLTLPLWLYCEAGFWFASNLHQVCFISCWTLAHVLVKSGDNLVLGPYSTCMQVYREKYLYLWLKYCSAVHRIGCCSPFPFLPSALNLCNRKAHWKKSFVFHSATVNFTECNALMKVSNCFIMPIGWY